MLGSGKRKGTEVKERKRKFFCRKLLYVNPSDVVLSLERSSKINIISQTCSSYRSALSSSASTAALAITAGLINVLSGDVPTGLSNVHRGSCCFERHEHLLIENSRIWARDVDDWLSYIPVDGCEIRIWRRINWLVCMIDQSDWAVYLTQQQVNKPDFRVPYCSEYSWETTCEIGSQIMHISHCNLLRFVVWSKWLRKL